MAVFKVIQIIDGDTVKVSPNWQFTTPLGQHLTGETIRILGYTAPKKETSAYNYLKETLNTILLNKNVILKDPQLFLENNINQIACSVFVNNIEVSNYFPEYITK